MRLVVLHYHLNRGGVTSVIRSHLRSLATVATELDVETVTLAYGGRASDWFPEFERELPFTVEHLTIPSLEYDELQAEDQCLNETLRQALADHGYAPASTVLHAHNHALGKNAAFPRVLGQLASDGWPVLLQVHDFVEDLRPTNYGHLLDAYEDEQELWGHLYPQSPRIQYATLNQSDYETLKNAGVDESQLHLIPNPVDCDSTKSTASSLRSSAKQKLMDAYSETVAFSEDKPYVIYPVRGIRRKNLGEVLLWSVLLGDCTFSITLEPQNEKERTSYIFWRDFAESLSLPVLFGSGEHLTLDENYAAADAIISTSVAEGFGLVFLEAALRERPLFGRNLNGVTADFVANGMRFPGLADEMLVPVSASERELLRSNYERFSRQLGEDYRCSPNEDNHTVQLDELFDSEFIDFGRLGRQHQANVISKAKSDTDFSRTIIERNPVVDRVRRAFLVGELDSFDASAENQKAIEQHYSHETVGQKLAVAYRSLQQSGIEPVQQNPDIGRNLLDHFVRPQHLRPLRIEP